MRVALAACLCCALVSAACAPARVRLPSAQPSGSSSSAAGAPPVAPASGPFGSRGAGGRGGTGQYAGTAAAQAAAGGQGQSSAPEADGTAATANDRYATASGTMSGVGQRTSSGGYGSATAQAPAAGGGAADGSEQGAAAEPPAFGSAGAETDGDNGARVSVAAVGASGPGRAAATAPAPVVPPLMDGLLDAVLPSDTSAYGLVLEDLASGARTAVNDAQTYPSASLYKLGLAWVTLRQVDAGELSLDAPITIEDDDAVEPEPDGGFGVGETPSIREALDAMLTVSSNAAAHALLRLVGRSAFTDEMDRIGLTQTRVPDDSFAMTSADDIAHLLRLIATSPELSAASRELIAEDMANSAPPDALRETLPDTVGVYDKTGNLDDASNVAALLASPQRTVILVVIDSGVDPGAARGIIAQAGMVAYQALLAQ